MGSFVYDLRFALRALRKNPILSAVALISLGIGIGANTAIFTILDRLLLRSLPVRDPDRLVMFVSPGPLSGFVETSYGNYVSFSWPKYRALRDRSEALFDGLLARFPFGVAIAANSQTDRARGELVSGNYFAVLRVRPALGRLISDDDARTRGANPVAVLSYGYWMRRFGGNAAVLNRSITVNGEPLTVIGVAQAGFQSVGAGEAPAVFVPITMQPRMRTGFDEWENAHGYWLNIFGRLKAGIARERAEAGVAVLWRAILEDDSQQLPGSHTAALLEKYVTRRLELRAGGNGISAIRDDFSLPLYLLMGMVGLVLLIACANVANLLLGRAAARSKEIAIRAALGATRGRLIRHAMAESAILSLGGGLAGLLIAVWAGALILQLVPEGIPVAGIGSDPDGRVLAFTLGVSVLTGLLFGCLPALRVSRPDLAVTLKEQTATPYSGRHARFRKTLVAGQIALSLLLLAAAGLFAHSLYNLRNYNPGFRSDRVLTFSIDPPLNGYTPERSRDLCGEVYRALLSTPGVSGASMAKWALLTGSMNMSPYRVEGYENGKRVVFHENRVGPEFFGAMGIPLVAGREFHEGDSAAAPPVAIVNESLAKKFFEGRNPIGLHLTAGQKAPPIEIVGIVKDSKYDDLREQPQPFLYLAAAQDGAPGTMTFYVRSALDPEALSVSLRQLVQRLDANLPVTGPKLLREQILESVFLDRMVAALACAFAALATVLAAVGLYGVIAWAVTQRKREIGIRMAMGADPGTVMRMVLGEVFRLAAAGIAVAVPAWAAIATVLTSQLFGMTSFDPVTLAAAIAVLAGVAVAAGLAPALRASRMDPNSAIRCQ